MGEMSPATFESNTVLGNAKQFSLQSTLNLSIRGQTPGKHFANTPGPLPTPCSEEIEHREHELIEYQEDNNTWNERQSPELPADKQPNEMSFRELKYLVSHLQTNPSVANRQLLKSSSDLKISGTSNHRSS